MIDRTSPISGPVAHVYVDDGDGRCVCGADRLTGLHVCDDGTPVPDLGGLVEALQAVSDACQAAIDKVLEVDDVR